MEMNHMAKLQPISNITFSQNLLQPWGKTWLDTVSSTVGKAKNANCFDRKQAMDFGKALDPIVGDAIAQMLGGIPVKAPLSQNALLPPVADCVEVGDTRIIGGVRPQNFDMAYRPDGVRIAYDSKTLNDAKSIKKNWQNMINDIRRDFLLPSKVKRENIRYDRRPSCNVKIDKEKAIEYLCGVIDYKKYTEKEFESVRNTLMISKSKRCKMQQLLEQGNIVTEDESKLALKLRSLKRSGQKIVEVQFTDSQDHLRGSARVKIEDLLYALVEREALLPSYCDRHDSGTCDFLERLEKFGQENNVKLYDIMTFDNITKIKSLLDDAILYKK